jgi:hypothetical protein
MKHKLFNIFVIALILFQAVLPVPVLAATQTNFPDYAPGSVVTISGDNSNSAGYTAGETVHVDVSGPNSYTATCDASADANAVWSCPVTLGTGQDAVGNYTYTASGANSGTSESSAFTVSAPPPVVEPTQVPTLAPTAEPTQAPTLEPTAEPTQAPTTEPTAEPTQVPTLAPTQVPTTEPTLPPTAEPTSAPTTIPTAIPTVVPTPALPPFIQSDQADYYMGSFVTLTSGNWQPNEWVVLYVNDDSGQTWSLTVNVQADPSGAFTYRFSLPYWFVATYRVIATGAVSGVATMTFTDSTKVGSVTVGAQTGVLTTGTAGSATYTIIVIRDATGAFDAALSLTTILPSGATASFSRGTLAACGGPGDKTCFDSSNNTIRFASGDNSLTVLVTIITTAASPAGSTPFTVKAATSAADFATGNGTLTIAGKANQTITFGTLSGKIFGDAPFTVSATASSGLAVGFSTTTTSVCTAGGTNGATITIVGTGTCTVVANQAGNATYNPATPVSQSFTVEKKTVTATVTAANKVYDASNTATISLCTLSGVVGTDVVTCSAGAATFADKNVGMGKNVTATGITLAGANAGNYQLASTTAGTTANITARPITVTAATDTRVYDGTTSSSGVPTITSGTLASGETATWTQTFNNQNVGTGKTLTPSGAVTDGNSGNNYAVTFVNNTTGEIKTKPITVTAVAKTKVYGAGDPALTYTSSPALVTGDTFTGVLTRAAGENVGTYAIGQGSLALSTNYALTYIGANLSITERAVTITADAKSKTYGDSDPALTYKITSGSLAFTDAFTGSLTRAAGEIVGTYAITQGTVALNSNYSLAYVGANLSISKRAVTITADARIKTYGDADPALTYQITSGSLATGDAFTGALARVAGEVVGTYAITQGTVALSDNYTLAYVGANLSITKRSITITADAKSKTYGDLDPALTYQITSGSLAFSDAFTGSLARAAGEDIGPHAITQGTLVLNSNYDLTYVGADLTIGKRSVEITADAQSKTYGDADPALTYKITSGTLAFTDAFTGSLTRDAGEDVGAYVINQGTVALGDNYTLTFVGANLTIGKRAVTITADAQSKTYGDDDPALTYKITSGTLAFTDAFTGSLTRDAGEDVGAYAITQGTVALGDNYTLTFVGANLTIGKRAVTITADAQSKTYGDTDPALTYQITSGTLAFSDAFLGSLTRDAGEDVGAYAITQGTIALGGNYTLTFMGADLTIGKRSIEITAEAKSKTYGDADPALTYKITNGSLAFSDAVTGSLTRDAGEDVGTYSITQGSLALNSNYALTYIGANLTIAKRLVEITADAQSKTYGDADPALTYKITNGSLAFSDAFTGSLTRDAGEDVGAYVINQGTVALTDNYTLTYVGANLTIDKRSVKITADAQSKTYGDADPALTYQISSGSLAFTDAFTGALTRDAGENFGSYPIRQGTLALNGNYNLSYVGANLTIEKLPVTVTADVQNKTYGDSDPALTYTFSPVLVGSDSFSGSLSRDPGEQVGQYVINQGSLVLSTNYTLTYVGANLTIGKRSVEITADAQSKTYGDVDPSLTYQITSGALAFSDAFIGSLTRDPGEDVGAHTITQGTVALNSNYDLTYVGADLTISKRSVEITANAQSKTYGDTDPTLTYHISSGSLAFSDAFIGSLTRVTGETVGAYAIGQGTVALNSNYVLTFVGADLTISKRPVEITADAKSKTYGDTDPVLTYQITSGSLAFSDAFTGALIRDAGENVGTYAIQKGTVALSGNYTLSYISANFTITKATLIVTADDKSREYGDADPAFTASYSGFKNNETLASSGVTGAPSLTTLATASSPVPGPYTITAANGTLASGNYGFTFVDGNLTITKATLTVTADDKSREYGDANPTFTASYNGFKNGETLASSGVTGDPSLTTLANATSPVPGPYTITAANGTLTSGNYDFAFVNGNLNITKASLTVTPADASREYGDANPSLTGSISGQKNGESFTATFATAATPASPVGNYGITVDTVSGVTLSNYEVVKKVGKLTITKAILTVTADDKSREYGNANPTFTASYSGFKNGETLATSGVTGASSLTTLATATSPVPGPYTITAAIGTLASGNYSFTFVNGKLSITKATLIVTPADSSREYGDANPGFTGSISGQKNGESFTATYTTAATPASPVGNYSITVDTVSGATLSNYEVVKKVANLTITKATLTVTADNQTKLLNAPNPPLTFKIIGFKNGETASVLTTQPTCTSTAATTSPAGSYPITCSGAAANNYAFSYVGGTLTIMYRFDGFLQPINDTAHSQICGPVCPVSIFKGGSTVPVKFQLKDANGNIVQASTAPIWVSSLRGGPTTATIDENVYTDQPTTGTTYRWDGQQYIYNWSTKGLTAGYYYRIGVTLGDGNTYYVYIGLR